MILKYLLLFGFFVMVIDKGNACTEQSKPHLTRCDMYFKCAQLPSQNHVWIPTKCDRGLIYEQTLGLCVLPGEDWECTLGDETVDSFRKKDDNNVYGVNNLQYANENIQGYSTSLYYTDEEEDHSNDNVEVNEAKMLNGPVKDILSNEESYDENNIEIIDGYDNALLSNDKQEIVVNEDSAEPDEQEGVFFSGDGPLDKSDGGSVEEKENYIAIPINSDPNSSVASHLQRLSQLIQSLNSSQHIKSQSYELGPNELNNFLTNHNIKAEYNNQLANTANKHIVPDDGRISPEHLAEILDLQQKLQSLNSIDSTAQEITTLQPLTISDSSYFKDAKYPDKTSIKIKGPHPVKGIRNTETGYSSSQIVVNRPEGSVLFSLPASSVDQINRILPNQQQQQQQSDTHMSQETLKTVLELSKQLIASNNQQIQQQQYNQQQFNQPQQQQQAYNQQNYLQPIFRPVYYNIPIHDIPIPIISNYEKKEQKQQTGSYDDDINYQKIASTKGYVDVYSGGSAGSSNKYKDSIEYEENKKPAVDEHATIIHNHIPITIENPKPTKNRIKYQQHTTEVPTTTTTSDPSTQYDSYGSKIHINSDPYKNYYPYPPFSETREQPIAESSASPYTSYLQEQLPPPYSTQYHSYVLYPQSSQQSPPANFYQPQQTASTNNDPFNQYNPNLFTQSPHLNDKNVNNYINSDTPIYPTLRPSSYYSSTAQPSFTYNNQIISPSHINGEESISNINNYVNNDHHHHRQYNQQLNVNDDAEQENSDYNNNNEEEELDYANDDEHNNRDSDEEDAFVDEDIEEANMNESNVINLLTDLSQTKKSIVETKQLPADYATSHFNRRPLSAASSASLFSPGHENKKQIVQFGGNFMTLEEYQRLVAPLVQHDALDSSNVEVITCVTGARQPSSVDCTKYIVCNAKTTKVLTYSCPPFTAFNTQSRYCDAKTYASCQSTSAIVQKTQFTIDGNKKIQLQAQQALDEAKRIRAQALKTQELTNLIKLETQNILSTKRKPVRVKVPPLRLVRTTTQRPIVFKKNKPIRRRIPCREPSKVADSLSQFNYFTCFTGSNGKLKARKMTCPNGLVFCSSMKLCTSASRCLK